MVRRNWKGFHHLFITLSFYSIAACILQDKSIPYAFRFLDSALASLIIVTGNAWSIVLKLLCVSVIITIHLLLMTTNMAANHALIITSYLLIILDLVLGLLVFRGSRKLSDYCVFGLDALLMVSKLPCLKKGYRLTPKEKILSNL